MRRGRNWRVKLNSENEVVEEVVENNNHLLDEENLDEAIDLNHEASDGSDSGDGGSPWVSYIESQS